MTGTTIAQAIPIAISPILTRIYTPEDFGLFALFLAITTIFGSIANGRYELAIMLPKKDEDAINIFALGFIITCCLSFVLFLLVILFNDYFTTLLGNEEIRLWLYLVPLSVFLTGIYNILTYFNNRKKKYKDLAKATVIKSIALAITQLLVGLIKEGVLGLVSGYIISQFFANVRLLKNIISNNSLISKISIVNIKTVGKRYIKFPKYLILAHGMNTISNQLPILLIGVLFNSTSAGFLTLTQRVLGIPINLIANSIGDVFREEASKCYIKNKECKKIYVSTLKKLIIISIIPFGLIVYFSPYLFSIIFGEEWGIAGEYLQILSPMYFIRFITTPLSSMGIIAEKQKIDLIWQSILFLLLVTLFLIDFDSEKNLILMISLIYSIMYLTALWLNYTFSRGEKYEG